MKKAKAVPKRKAASPKRSPDKISKEFARIKSLQIPAKRIVWEFCLSAKDEEQLDTAMTSCVEFFSKTLGARKRAALDTTVVGSKTMQHLFIKFPDATPGLVRELDRGMAACCQGTRVACKFLGFQEEVYPWDSWKTLASVLRKEEPSKSSNEVLDCRELRFDGLYYHDLGGGGDYLRFYPDGKFVSAAVSGDEGVAKVAKWLRRENKDMPLGTYTLKATTLTGEYQEESVPGEDPIQFKIKARLTKQGLKVRTWSSYSNEETEETFTFYDV